jgi:hypothetical protein
MLTPDADDTALAWMALVIYDRRRKTDMNLGLQALRRARIYHRRGDEPSWARVGAFRTWLVGQGFRNPVDCCVNANVASFYAMAGETDSEEYAAAVATIADAVSTTGGGTPYMRTLAPFYAHPIELRYAVQRAVEVGAAELLPTLERISVLREMNEDALSGWPLDRPVCCNAHGRPVWRSPALQTARALRSRHRRPIPAIPEGVKQCS